MTKAKQIRIFSWATSTLVTAIAVIAWSQSLDWGFGLISSITLFPLLGLLAFSLMWSHYIASVARQIFRVDKSALTQYFEITSWIVLVAIFLHPGLLFYGLFKQGYGLPPGSYLNHYIAPGAAWATLLGTVSFFIFLSYELRRRYESESWWKYIAYASDMAMIAIFIHALRLGGLLQTGWFKLVWYFYGVTLVASLVYIYHQKRKAKL